MREALEVRLENEFAQELRGMYVPWEAAKAVKPEVLVLNEALARELGLDPSVLASPEGAAFLVGNQVPEEAVTVAQAYSGHQFGGLSPLLGDGRALLLGEIVGRGGERRDLHLKGSGRTPFSRGGDGYAALGPMLREHLMGEAMHALGIPTTRSLAVTATGSSVRREEMLPGAVLARIAASHLRVGSFEFTQVTGDRDLLERLANYAIKRHHPGAAEADSPYLALLEAVIDAQAALVAKWMLAGFVHGVMNTDNMTISGETIDYGPCAFLDAYDPATVYSSIDHRGRYAYKNQPAAAQWNLAKLAEALLPLLGEEAEEAADLAMGALGTFLPKYQDYFQEGMRRKLGLSEEVKKEQVQQLSEQLHSIMEASKVDYTSFMRKLIRAARGDAEPVRAEVLDLPGMDAWIKEWESLGPDAAQMEGANPVYIPRNHLVEEALSAATGGDMGAFNDLLAVVKDPYEEKEGMERYAEGAPVDFGKYQTYCGT